MLVDTLGDVVITNDGVTILKEMDIEHPAAKMIVEVARTKTTKSETERPQQSLLLANCSEKQRTFSNKTCTPPS